MFDKQKITELYPGAEDLMFEPAGVWKLPKGKEHKLADIYENGKYFLQEKIDGAMYQFVVTESGSYLFGRTISAVTGLLTEKSKNVPHIKEALSCLPPGTILIGEIYIPGGEAKDTVRIMGCLPAEAIKRQNKQGLIKYYLHDIIFYNGTDLMKTPAEERYEILAKLWNDYDLRQFDFLRLAEKVDENLEEETSRILAAGGEGVVLKKRTAIYSPGKKPAWDTIKIKKMDSVDLVCMGVCPPTKEYTGTELNTWQYWVDKNDERCEGSFVDDPNMKPVTKPYFFNWPSAIQIGAYDKEGKLKLVGTVSSGLTEADKKALAEKPDEYLMKVVALDCMELDRKEKTLRHPILKAWRDDKNASECKLEEIFA